MANPRSKSKKVTTSDIKDIISEAMERKEVKHRLVPYEDGKLSFETLHRSKRYFEKHGLGKFYCPKKDNVWTSVKAWCILDLKQRKIRYTYYQKCNKCETIVRPFFFEEVIEKMARYAVDSYLRCIGKKGVEERVGVATEEEIRGKHDEKRCENA